ncbi:MAG: HAD-IIB family hydrolase [Xanthomonadales bacterium]|nr:HAD-IIB family hydrolase [Xanthomonadales bacterium]
MTERLLIATDLDRTLIPNGPQPESPTARKRFARLASRDEVTLAYVSGRHIGLVRKAMYSFGLPQPDFIIGDVGTTIYQARPGAEPVAIAEWEDEIARDWSGCDAMALHGLLSDLTDLRLQEADKQNRCKLSYYLPLGADTSRLAKRIEKRLERAAVRTRLIFSIDEPRSIGLLDVLPERASKRHALEYLMKLLGHVPANTVFCGDSGNDLEVLVSAIPGVLVANSDPTVQEAAQRSSTERGLAHALYVARGAFLDMNGNYAAGILEGIAHFHPSTVEWMTIPAGEETA